MMTMTICLLGFSLFAIVRFILGFSLFAVVRFMLDCFILAYFVFTCTLIIHLIYYSINLSQDNRVCLKQNYLKDAYILYLVTYVNVCIIFKMYT